jgi:hypothetical protein
LVRTAPFFCRSLALSDRHPMERDGLDPDTKHISIRSRSAVTPLCRIPQWARQRSFRDLWRIDADGTNEKQLTSGLNEQVPALRPGVGLLRRNGDKRFVKRSGRRRLSNHRPPGRLPFSLYPMAKAWPRRPRAHHKLCFA